MQGEELFEEISDEFSFYRKIILYLKNFVAEHDQMTTLKKKPKRRSAKLKIRHECEGQRKYPLIR